MTIRSTSAFARYVVLASQIFYTEYGNDDLQSREGLRAWIRSEERLSLRGVPKDWGR